MGILRRINAKKEEALRHQGFRRYAANTGWMFAVQILRMISGLLVGVWVARYLGPEKYGVFNYAIAFTVVFGGVAKLGLDGILVRDLVKNPENRDLYLGTAFWLKLVAAVITVGVIIGALLFTDNDSTTRLYVGIIAVGLIFQSFDVVDYYFQSKVLSKFVSICKITQLILSAIVKIYLIFINANLVWFVLVVLLDQVVMAISLVAAYSYQQNGAFYGCFNVSIARRLLKDSWPLVLSGIAVAIYMRVGQLMIKDMLGTSALGIYSAAVRLSEAWYFIPVIVTNSLFPAIINAQKSGDSLYYDRLQRLLVLMTWASIVVAVPITLLSDWLIDLLYGPAYAAAAPVLKVYVWGGVFVNLGVVSGKWLLSENYQQIAFFRTFCGVVTNVVLNIALIPKYGILGAAYAALGSYGMAGFIYDFFDPRTKTMFKMKTASFSPWRIVSRV